MLICAHLVSAGAVMVALTPWQWRALAAVALALNACWALKRHALLLGRGAVAALEFRGECDCSIVYRDRSHALARVQGSSHLSGWLTVLHLRQSDRRRLRYVVLMPDSVAPDDLRRLRVRLRWSHVPGEAIDRGDTRL